MIHIALGSMNGLATRDHLFDFKTVFCHGRHAKVCELVSEKCTKHRYAYETKITYAFASAARIQKIE